MVNTFQKYGTNVPPFLDPEIPSELLEIGLLVVYKTWHKHHRCFSPKSEHGDILEDVGNPEVNVGHENGNEGPELLMTSSCIELLFQTTLGSTIMMRS